MQILTLATLLAAALAAGSTNDPEWPQWRGPFNTGMADGDAPLEWDASDIRWQLEIPGRGHSTPVVAGNRMFMAIRLGRKGNLTETDAIVWSTARGAAYTPSPVLHDGRLYVVTDNGMVSCFDAATGKPHYQQERLPKPYNFKASPVGANGKLYLATEEGDVVVMRMGDRFDVLATNTMDDQSFIASPVIVDETIYLRSRTHLFAIGGDGSVD